jgi:hypothetical protein
MSKKLSISIGIFIILLFGVFFFVSRTPQYSIYKLQEAIKNKDSDGALKYIDIDSIADNMMREMMEKQKHPRDSWESAGNAIGKGMLLMMMPSLKESMKSMLKTTIVSSDTGSGFGVIQAVSAWSCKVRRDGRSAAIYIKDGLVFKMAQHPDGYWRVVQIINQK